MKLREFFDRAVAAGRASDPRGEDGILGYLARERRTYENSSDDAKGDFDVERLVNPYHDTRILNGPEDTDVQAVMVGIDFEVGELVLADRLRERGTQLDLCVAHHPEGSALANLYRVMEMQADIMAELGVPINVAEGILDPRLHEVKRRLLAQNHFRSVAAAKLLGLPFMCLHTVADNCVTKYLQDLFDEKKPEVLSEVVALLKAQPEYADAKLNGTGLQVLSRSIKSESDLSRIRAGEVFVDMTGGTGGSKWMFEKLATNTNVGTFVAMHVSEDNLEIAKKNHINVVIAGHMASDSLGLNLLLDSIAAGEKLEIVACSGFTRIERG
ncbi:MAG: NGG1p interacting factor NIF3 [Candidatus Zixiibacteriota bacterium]